MRSLIYIQRAQYWQRHYRWFTLVTCWDWAKLPPLGWVCGVAPEVYSVRNKVTALVTMAPLFPRPDCDSSSQLVWYTLTNHHNHGYAGYGKPKPRNRLLISHLRCVSLETIRKSHIYSNYTPTPIRTISCVFGSNCCAQM